MKTYLDLLRHILDHGETKDDRTNTGTRSVFGYQIRHHMPTGFPLLTTKKIHIRSIIHELLWFLRGETNIRSLQAAGVTIWDEWADENGDLGPVYGHQWRHFGGIDQIRTLLNDLAENPHSRRHIVSAWNPADVPFMALPPCHVLWQCNVSNGHIDLHMYQRSADSFLGVPFNIASYAFLLAMIGHVTGLKPRDLIISYGDLHIYSNHMEQVAQQLTRWPRKLPTLHFARQVQSIDDFRFEDFVISGYDPHPAIKAPVAV